MDKNRAFVLISLLENPNMQKPGKIQKGQKQSKLTWNSIKMDFWVSSKIPQLKSFTLIAKFSFRRIYKHLNYLALKNTWGKIVFLGNFPVAGMRLKCDITPLSWLDFLLMITCIFMTNSRSSFEVERTKIYSWQMLRELANPKIKYQTLNIRETFIKGFRFQCVHSICFELPRPGLKARGILYWI